MEEKYGAEVELVPGVGGVFEITVDGALKFSKKQTGRFPTDEEVIAAGQSLPEEGNKAAARVLTCDKLHL